MRKILSLISLLVVFTIFIPFELDAQKNKGFSGKPETFISELKELAELDVNLKGDDKKECEKLIEEFEEYWTNYSIQQRKDIVNLSQSMYKKNIRIRNGFMKFIKTQLAFQSSNISPENYTQWLKSMHKCLAEHNVKIYNQIVESTYDLVTEGYLYKSKNVAWYMGEAGGFDFRDDKEKGLYADFTSEIDLTYRSMQDSTTIHSTLGRLYLKDSYFEGKGGIVDWSKLGLSQDEVFVELSDYGASLNKAYLFADSVWFTNKKYFSYKLNFYLFVHTLDIYVCYNYHRFVYIDLFSY